MESEAPQKATETIVPAAEPSTSAQAGLSAKGKGLVATLALLALGLLGYGMMGQKSEVKEPAPQVAAAEGAALQETQAGAASQEASTTSPQTTLSPEEETAAALEPAPLETDPVVVEQEIAAPSITTWAVTQEGIATIAGLAHPRAMVQILRDGLEVDKTQASGAGEFALITTLAPNSAPSFLTLRMVLEDGRSILSQSGVALGPIGATASASAAQDQLAESQPAAEKANSDQSNLEQANSEQPAADQSIEPLLNAEAPAPAALLISDQGAVLLQSPEGAAPENRLSLATISYSPEGAVQLSGLATGSSNLQLYLDNAPLQQVSVAPSGQWLTTLPEIEPGRYILRIDQLDEAGAVAARIESPFERETLARLNEVASAQSETLVEDTAPEGPVLAQEESAPLAPKAPVSITVQPGHSLWAIAREELGSGILYVQVLEANRNLIRNPDLIYPGQVFNLPKAE